MRKYGEIYGTEWVRPDGIFRQLRGDAHAQVVAAYFLSAGEMHMSGVARIRTSAIAEDTGVPIEAVRASLARLEALGFAFTDPEDGLVWVPTVPRDQFGACLSPRDDRAKLITKYLDTIGPHPFVALFREALQFPDERPPRTPPATPRPTPRGAAPPTPVSGSGSGSGSETKSGAVSGTGAGAPGEGESRESLEGRRGGERENEGGEDPWTPPNAEERAALEAELAHHMRQGRAANATNGTSRGKA